MLPTDIRNKNDINRYVHISDSRIWNQFSSKADTFMKYTSNYAHQDISPGGYYSAIWMRDAAYILKDHFLLAENSILPVLEQELLIWSHQINSIPTDKEKKIVYGRGSPETNFKPLTKDIAEISKKFNGALPTTIYQDFCDIYGLNPDIDSTALMISSTSWILFKLLNEKLLANVNNTINIADDSTVSITNYQSLYKRDSSLSTSDFLVNVIKYLIPRMLNAVKYLRNRDIDNDGLVEQEYNEDWMDTALRAGKVVYSQACWILALQNLSLLLTKLGDFEAAHSMMILASTTVNAVEEILWSEENACYMDVLQGSYVPKQQEEASISIASSSTTILTQDVSLYLVAVTENITERAKNNSNYNNCLLYSRKRMIDGTGNTDDNDVNYQIIKILQRATKTLDTLKSRIWKNQWPLVTEDVLKTTGPWVLKPNQYHNHTFWPWITAIEMLARSRFTRYEECDILLSRLTTECSPNILSFYEWIDPITAQGNGAFPFRTGISAVRIAIFDILDSNNNSNIKYILASDEKTNKTKKESIEKVINLEHL
jgi:hypothetical protein